MLLLNKATFKCLNEIPYKVYFQKFWPLIIIIKLYCLTAHLHDNVFNSTKKSYIYKKRMNEIYKYNLLTENTQ